VSYDAYVALGAGDEVLRMDPATGKITGTLADKSGESVAVTPDGSTLYIADTGQYDVLAHDLHGRGKKRIVVGPYPQDVAISPAGSVVYATVTGGDTGTGGSGTVAAISTATNTVTARIRVGTAPRQVVFSPDGEYAYVTTQDGIDVIDVGTSSVLRAFRHAGPQGIAVGADGRTLYVTYPAANKVEELNAVTGARLGDTTVGAEPYAVVTAGPSVYVADMNDDQVSVLSSATGRVTGRIDVGRLPMSLAVTPDGAQVWVGNGLSGSISVISVASGKVVRTISGGPGTSAVDTAPLGIAFAQAHPSP
jgi:YVTN family beta-propeller protein